MQSIEKLFTNCELDGAIETELKVSNSILSHLWSCARTHEIVQNDDLILASFSRDNSCIFLQHICVLISNAHPHKYTRIRLNWRSFRFILSNYVRLVWNWRGRACTSERRKSIEKRRKWNKTWFCVVSFVFELNSIVLSKLNWQKSTRRDDFVVCQKRLSFAMSFVFASHVCNLFD